jgi:ribonuclease-3
VTDRGASYERLEFLGDAVLGAAVAEAVWRRFPAAPEGTLARMKAYAVSREACAQVAERLDLGARLAGEGRATGGEAAAQLARNRRVLAAVLEAAIGAVYLTHGWETTRAAVVEAFDEQLRFARHGHVDVKTELQEHLHRQTRSVEYVLVGDTGPPHLRRFVVAALVDGVEVGRGEGASKKAAEQAAAAGALARLRPGPEHDACT